MKVLSGILLIMAMLLTTACSQELPFEERDRILLKAFIDINSQQEYRIKEGLYTIRKYPTHEGLMRTISLWESEITLDIEKEAIKTLNIFESFRKDSALIMSIFDKNYNSKASKEKKLKLIRLLSNTDVNIRGELIKRIDAEMAAAKAGK